MKHLIFLAFFVFFALAGYADSMAGGASNSVDLLKQSTHNLKQIGEAVFKFASRKRERFPKDFTVLVKEAYIKDLKHFISPLDKKSAVGSEADFDPDKNCSYVYLGTGGVVGNFGGKAPIAFEKPWLLPEQCDAIAVLMSDGSVRIVKISGVRRKNCRKIAAMIINKSLTGSERELILKNAQKVDALSRKNKRRKL